MHLWFQFGSTEAEMPIRPQQQIITRHQLKCALPAPPLSRYMLSHSTRLVYVVILYYLFIGFFFSVLAVEQKISNICLKYALCVRRGTWNAPQTALLFAKQNSASKGKSRAITIHKYANWTLYICKYAQTLLGSICKYWCFGWIFSMFQRNILNRGFITFC